jgi:putative peptidoglycan lipid II flippase
MIALAGPVVDIFRGGKFNPEDAQATAGYFAIFALTLFLWSAQGIYARAFYAAGNTLTPAISGTVITVVSIPCYALLYQTMGINGLAIASDLGIFLLTVTLAIQLHRKRLVSLASLEYAELLRSLVVAVIGYAAATAVVRWLPHPPGHPGDVVLILTATLLWLAISLGGLLLLGSKLPAQLRKRR